MAKGIGSSNVRSEGVSSNEAISAQVQRENLLSKVIED